MSFVQKRVKDAARYEKTYRFNCCCIVVSIYDRCSRAVFPPPQTPLLLKNGGARHLRFKLITA